MVKRFLKYAIVLSATVLCSICYLKILQFSKQVVLLQSPAIISVMLPGEDIYTPYPLYDPALKNELLSVDNLWKYSYEFKISASFDAFLISQFIDGGAIYLNNVKVSELPRSDSTHKRIWFRPHLVYLPHQSKSSSYHTIRIESASYLRYSYVMPIYAGKLTDVQALADVLLFVSRTLAVALSISTFVVSILLLATWYIDKSDFTFLSGGVAAVAWALLYLLLNYTSIPSDSIKLFRFLMYLLIAISIYNIVQYITKIALGSTPRFYVKVLQLVTAAGPIFYVLTLGEQQKIIDKIWIGCMFIAAVPGCYLYFKQILIKPSSENLSFGGAIVLSFFAALRDSRFIGYEQVTAETRSATAWDLIDSPMLVSYIAIPLMFVLGLGRVLRNYKSSREKILQHNSILSAALEQKELQLRIAHLDEISKKRHEFLTLARGAIHRDLHDGVGSRLVATTFALRSGGLTREKLEDSLVKCLNDIKAMVQIEKLSDVRSIQAVLFEYCLDIEEVLSGTNVRLAYSISDECEFFLLHDASSQMLKMVQEIISNALKHSNVCEICVVLKLSSCCLCVTITETVIPPVENIGSINNSYPTSSLGLKNLHFRSKSIGATFFQVATLTTRESFILLRLFG